MIVSRFWISMLTAWMCLGVSLSLHANTPRLTACVGEPITFPTQIEAVSARIISYAWDFGDPSSGPANFSDLESPSHIYDQIGEYLVSLTIESVLGPMDTIFTKVEVFPRPQPDFWIDGVCVSSPTKFGAEVLRGTTGGWIWQWDFGDGKGSAVGKQVAYQYSDPGKYEVTLKVISRGGCEVSATDTVNLLPAPLGPRLTGDSICFGDRALLLAETADSVQIFWYEQMSDTAAIGMGHRFVTEPLAFSEKYYAEVHTGQLCRSVRKSITAAVFSEEDVSIRIDPGVVLEDPNTPLSFSVFPEQPIQSYIWDFGNGESSQAANPVWNNWSPGQYEVSVMLQNSKGCALTLRESFTLQIDQEIKFPEAFSPNGDGIQDEFFISAPKLKVFYLKVLDDFGQIWFETRDRLFRWDGMGPDGEPAPAGFYQVQVMGNDEYGTDLGIQGSLMLLR
ncbi:PKD domain-containing protein [Pontibacter sp. G13]|uniref:PKD domain-containing protein n=1 Tax=Pontibacter sp. G13 TaxID=3074898 RepID=UPI00288C0AF2|nr:PKD domain-containing protein [Pontibacter sp. G13]WNJ16257.1 PKD domain-containing protein [Pontibacter sp. G13]